jgi:hypothetical protein
MAENLFELEGEKYVWIHSSFMVDMEGCKFWMGGSFTKEQLLENEKQHSPQTYELICDFFKDLHKKEPYWTREGSVPACECGSEKTYGPGSPHSRWCPKS